MTDQPRGPVHVTGEVLASKRVGAYRHLTLVAPGIPERFRPGTFVALSTGPGRIARRAMWIHRIKPTGGYGATIELVVEPVGPGTEWLVGLPVAARLDAGATLLQGYTAFVYEGPLWPRRILKGLDRSGAA